MMDVWARHELRLRRLERTERRQAELRRMDTWLLEHPHQAAMIALGLSILILELSELLRFGLDALVAWLAT